MHSVDLLLLVLLVCKLREFVLFLLDLQAPRDAPIIPLLLWLRLWLLQQLLSYFAVFGHLLIWIILDLHSQLLQLLFHPLHQWLSWLTHQVASNVRLLLGLRDRKACKHGLVVGEVLLVDRLQLTPIRLS